MENPSDRREIKLDIAIATWQPEGIYRVADMNLPEIPGVRYIVSWQQAGEHPELPESIGKRQDIEVHLYDGKGVSGNRNNALDYSMGELILMADDDLRYDTDELQKAISLFDERPGMDLAIFRFHGCPNEYLSEETIIRERLPKGLMTPTFVIMARKKSIKELRFDTLFGPGAPVWGASEDEKFLYDARKRGLDCRYLPYYIAAHEHSTTGSRRATEATAAASGKYARLEYPVSWVLRLPLKAWREWRLGHRSFFWSMKHYLRGAFSKGR